MVKKFFYKFLLLSSPLLILVGLFVFYDPFKIIYEYEEYSNDLTILNNRDFVSTRVFERNYPKQQYNSFLFGSSRTMAFNVLHWKRYLDSTARVFSFDAFGESIFGIFSKLKFLDEKNVDIKNCILIFCEDVTFHFSDDHPGHLYMKDPLVAKTSFLNFYFEHFKAFLGREFIIEYLKELIKGESELVQRFGNEGVSYDVVTNAMSHQKSNREIQTNAKKYYQSKMNVFYKRPIREVEGKQKINKKQIKMLFEIAMIFKKHHTNYKIILSPLYSQLKFNRKDKEIIESIFKGHVYDFSGKNKITEDYHNYYEKSHYLPKIGDSLMSIMYGH